MKVHDPNDYLCMCDPCKESFNKTFSEIQNTPMSFVDKMSKVKRMPWTSGKTLRYKNGKLEEVK